MAWEIILLETSMGPRSSKGRIIGHGNLVEANAILKKAGNAIAVSQRMVFHLSSFFFSVFFKCCFCVCCWFGLLEGCGETIQTGCHPGKKPRANPARAASTQNPS